MHIYDQILCINWHSFIKSKDLTHTGVVFTSLTWYKNSTCHLDIQSLLPFLWDTGLPFFFFFFVWLVGCWVFFISELVELNGNTTYLIYQTSFKKYYRTLFNLHPWKKCFFGLEITQSSSCFLFCGAVEGDGHKMLDQGQGIMIVLHMLFTKPEMMIVYSKIFFFLVCKPFLPSRT